MKTNGIVIDGYEGTYKIADVIPTTYRTFYIIEHEERPEEEYHIILNDDEEVILEEVTGGIYELRSHLIEYPELCRPKTHQARLLEKIAEEEEDNGSTNICNTLRQLAKEIEKGREVSPEEIGEVIYQAYTDSITFLLEEAGGE